MNEEAISRYRDAVKGRPTPPRALTEAEATEIGAHMSGLYQALCSKVRSAADPADASPDGVDPLALDPEDGTLCGGCRAPRNAIHSPLCPIRAGAKVGRTGPAAVTEPVVRSDAGSDMTKREFIAHEAMAAKASAPPPGFWDAGVAVEREVVFVDRREGITITAPKPPIGDPICACGEPLSAHDAAGQYDPCPGGGGQFRDPPAAPSIAGPAGLDLAREPPAGHLGTGRAVERQSAEPPTRPSVGAWITWEPACGASIYDDHGQSVASAWETPDGWRWSANRPRLAPVQCSVPVSREEAERAAVIVLATWADVSAARGAK